MPLPRPEPGLVVRYDYLWSRRARQGAVTAEKARPACLLLTVITEDGATEVVLLPITHAPPAEGEIGVELPLGAKRALGLDDAQSWVIVSDGNLDTWPSPDLQQIPGAPGRFHYGLLPPVVFQRVRDAFAEAVRLQRVSLVNRDDEPNA